MSSTTILRRSAAGSAFTLVLCLAGIAAGQLEDAQSSARPQPFSGLARAPEANLFVGASTTSIPIDVPNSRHGLAPKLALTYASGGGPSPYGVGWDLPLGMIQRSGKSGALPCNDAAARAEFVLQLPGATVPCTLQSGSTRRRCLPRIEESFTQIFFLTASNTWEVWDKDGLYFVFGPTDTERIGSNVASSSEGFVSAADGTCSYTHSWALASTTNLMGDWLRIEYAKEDHTLYPARIVYGGKEARAGAAGAISEAFEIHFAWQPRPPGDRPSHALKGVLARLSKVLERIDVKHPISGPAVRAYHFAYDFDDPDPEKRRLGRQSLLTAVTMFGRSNQALARADGQPASTTFAYQQIDLGSAQFENAANHVASSYPPALPLAGFRAVVSDSVRAEVQIDLKDMNGDGFLDLVDTTGCSNQHRAIAVYFGHEGGFAEQAGPWLVPPFLQEPHNDIACRLSWVSKVWTGDYQLTDTIVTDLNGDGIPDWIDGRSLPWSVRFGYVNPGGKSGGFAAEATFWDTNGALLIEGCTFTGCTVHYAVEASDGSSASRDWAGLIDWNGDGRLDLINSKDDRVYLNTGSGFDLAGSPAGFPHRSHFRRKNRETHRLTAGLYDLNGDSLPDFVETAGGTPETWNVYFNEGGRLSASAVPWDIPPSCTTGLMAFTDGERGTIRDIVDMNGDGLLDIVDTCDAPPAQAGHPWTVYLNHGNGFRSPGVNWENGPSWIQRTADCSGSMDNACTKSMLVDFNGDGLPDYLHHREGDPIFWIILNRAGAWQPGCLNGNSVRECVELGNTEAPADHLIEIHNGTGAHSRLKYRPSNSWDNTDASGIPRMPLVLWTVTRIERNSGLAGVAPGAAELSTDILYGFGKFDAPSRELRGFGSVMTIDGGGTRRSTTFFQDEARKGRIREAAIYHPGPFEIAPDDTPIEVRTELWRCVDPATQANASCPDSLEPAQRRWVRLAETHRFDYGLNGANPLLRHSWQSNLSWDSYGNVTLAQANGSATQPVETRVEYIHVDRAANGGPFLTSKPKHVTARWNSQTLEERWLFYDAQAYGSASLGNVTRVETLRAPVAPGVNLQSCSQSAAEKCASTTTAYDDFGNPWKITDANGNTSYMYYDALQQYPARLVDAVGHETRLAHDPACGKLTAKSVLDGSLAGGDPARYLYDDFCRLQFSYLPGHSAFLPHRAIFYYLGSPASPGSEALATEIRTYEPTSTSAAIANEVHALFDGFGRPVQTIRTASVDGARVNLVDATTTYDVQGNLASVRSPFVQTQLTYGAGDIVRFVPPAPGELTTVEHDALGRVTRTRYPDGSETEVDRSNQGVTVATDACFHAANCPGGKTVEIRDVFERVIERQHWQEGSATMQAGTRYTYDGSGRLLTSVDWNGASFAAATLRKLKYDTAGNKIEYEDRDSELPWRYGYDAAGNLIYEDDPKVAQHIRYCYDSLGRVARKRVVVGADFNGDLSCDYDPASDTEYTYDDPAVPYSAGRLTKVIDPSGTSETLQFDIRGQVLTSAKGIVVGQSLEVAEFAFEPDYFGRLAALVYPDGERIEYRYDP
ncbi:MAG TPA: toxin TcdB middle/N-terminal domain-containing protein, partial [Terriglobales bacterium]|nr:toxin TcdB middle/N-terminal domain-containing protein [Terriglobales bacterium]